MKRILFATTFAFALLLASCEKFEEGGTFASSARHIIGTWNYAEVLVNNNPVDDSTFYSQYRNSTVVFERGSAVRYCWRNAADSLLEERVGSYVFNYNKKKMSIVFDVYPLDECVYEVRKLTKDEFWVEQFVNDTVHYQITFQKSTRK